MLAAEAGEERRGGLRAPARPAPFTPDRPRAAAYAPRLKRYRALYKAEKAARL